MATIKSYTDLQQSKKLAEILPLKSADMMYQENETVIGDDYGYDYRIQPFFSSDIDGIPCWSLAALLDILKDKITFGGASDKDWFVAYTVKTPRELLTIYESNLVDACVAMIEKLHELKNL